MLLKLALLLGTTAALLPPGGRRIKPPLKAEVAELYGGGRGRVESAGEAKLAVAGACAGVMLFGYHLGVVNAPLAAMSKTMNFGDATAGAIVSSSLLGATVGSVAGGAAADALGRRGAMRWNAALLAASAVGCAAATTVPQLLAARLAVGVAIGVISAVSPLYISEVSPRKQRGAFGALNQVSICLGILLSIVAGLGVTPDSPASRWRPMFAFAAVPAVLHGLMAMAIPESPKWPKSKTAKADAARLWGPGASAEMADAGAGGKEGGWGDMVSKQYRRATGTAFALFLLQQLSGINAVVYFSTQMFRDAGVASAVLASCVVALTNIFGTAFVAAPLVDRFGRTTMLSASFAGMAACMAVMGAALATPALAGTALLKATSVAGTILYIFAFACGCGPVPGLLTPELFPAALRAKGATVGMVSHWGWNTVVGWSFLPLVGRYSVPAIYGGFAAVAALGAAFAKFGVAETTAA